MTKSYRSRLLNSTLFVSAALLGAPAMAQDVPAEEPVVGEDAEVGDESADGNAEPAAIVVTGSRIARPNLEANTPIAVVEGEQLRASGDVTLETFLQTLPQANPAATTTSNNPGNQGRAEIDLRGLGSNRNIILVDGRRPMVSSSTMIVDLNTIPAALVERVDIISGGAGATYGADAVSGVVNLILKDNFEGIDGRVTYANTAAADAGEFNASLVLGANFNDNRGNAVFAFDFTDREALVKKQRAFAAFATSTTTFLPEGLYNTAGNAPTQTAVNTVFGRYGAAPGTVDATTGIGFNLDGTLFATGVAGSPLDVVNFRYPIDFAVNQNLYPDLYSYNFDEVNLLVLPLRRKSIMGKIEYEVSELFQPFAQFGWTRYKSPTALAPTPVPTVLFRDPTNTTVAGAAQMVVTSLVQPGQVGNPFLIVPVTNPFIPQDLRDLLNSRTGDDPTLVGSGATEPFLIRSRTLAAGARLSTFENTVTQYMGGVRGDFWDRWRYEAYYSEGRTSIVNRGTGAIDTQRLQNLLESPTGTISGCTYNPFGRNALSQACINYLSVPTRSQTDLKQRITQAYVTGPVVELPAGDLSVVLGAELRRFKYGIDPGSLSGPISGPNTVTLARGKNSFRDIFGEVLIPIARDAPFAQELEINLSGRISKFHVENLAPGATGILENNSTDETYGIQVNWQPIRPLRFRGTFQRAVRAPNFGELFAGGGSAPQYFDPCSANTQFRAGNLGLSAADALTFCTRAYNNGATSPIPSASFANYVQPPGSQLSINLAGNPNVSPEKANTFTVGMVWNSPAPSGILSTLRGSLDYYRINIKEAIITPDPNSILAACFNYWDTNPSFDPTNVNCRSIRRTGSALAGLFNPATGTNSFQVNNDAEILTSGIDGQLSWAVPLGNMGRFNFDLLASYLIEWKARDALPGLPMIDYAGTVGYFGQGLTGGGGASFPEWRGTLNTTYSWGDFSWNLRTRYIHSMENRAKVQYIGEDASFEDVGAAWYFDTAATWRIDNMMFRLGVNNLFDRGPELYKPNVQSGTDPSLYDVIGRRFFVSVGLKY